MKNNILLVDDEVNVLYAISRILHDEPFEIHTETSAEKALETMKNIRFKVVVSDERMPGMSGSSFLSHVKEHYPQTIRIMLTGHATLEAAMKAVNSGEIYRFFTKPWDDIELQFAIRSAVEKYDLEDENRRLLRTIRHQALEMKVLEKRYPGISRVKRNDAGSYVLPDISEEEISAMINQCEKEFP